MIEVMSEERFIYLEKAVIEIKKLLGQVHDAIIGNPLSKDGGIANRLIEAEQKLDDLENKIIETEKKQIGYNLYTKIMWISLGGVGMSIVAYVLTLIFNK